MSQFPLVLGIETSCDETAVALYQGGRGLLAQQIYSQVALHAQYGGVVPELAARDHVARLLPMVQQLCAETPRADRAGVRGVECVAYTAGPGLLGGLLVGSCVARALAWALEVPAIAVNHLEGHVLAPLLETTDLPAFPWLCLLVSGGHTQLIQVRSWGEYLLLGETLDDAVGEAFDKTASLLGLGYPGGAALSMMARDGDAEAVRMPRPMLDRPGLDMSFSGLKTAARTALAGGAAPADLAAGFEAAVVETLVAKCRRALRQYPANALFVSGGVAANQPLRSGLQRLGEQESVSLCFPSLALCTDNAAMIALAGAMRASHGMSHSSTAGCRSVEQPAIARWPLASLLAFELDAAFFAAP